jgi:Asp-tRNA(Asn)/Glu-tRNA(Gln) amidotransferase A subunit family amidase
MLRAVIEINPSALEQAAVLDAERKTHGSRGSLHGIPILLKDNIATMLNDGEFSTWIAHEWLARNTSESNITGMETTAGDGPTHVTI